MPNLAGTFDMRVRPAETSGFVARLVRLLDVPGINYEVRSWRDERFAAVNLLNGICGNLDQPASNANGTVLFLDGEVANLREVWVGATRVGVGSEIPSPARACLDLYEAYGNDFVNRLSGQFNILLYDSADRSVRVFNDRFAYRPFYYWCADGLAIFGLEKKALFSVLDRTPPLDPMGVLELMTFGHNLDDRTVFSGVRAMAPGAVVEFKDSRARSQSYWRPVYENRSATNSLEESAEELGRRVCRAMARWATPSRRYGIFLSGGLDSRAAAGALARASAQVTSFTFGTDDSLDLKYGRQLAAGLGFAHHRLRYDDVSFADLLPRIVWRTEGSIPFHQSLSIVHHGHIRAEVDVIFTGHFGDAVSGGHLLPGQFLVRGVGGLAEHIVTKRSMVRLPALRALFRATFFEGAHREMLKGIERCLQAFGEDRLPLAYNLWDMGVRQPRFTFSSPAVDRYAVEIMTPFTDNDVAEWMLRLPLPHLFAQRVYKRMMVRTFPEIAGVPWARTGRRIPANLAVEIAEEARSFAARRLRQLGARRKPAPMDPRLRSLATRVAGDLVADNLPGDIFDRDEIRRLGRAALNGSCSPIPLFLLLTLAECVRLFGTGGLADPPPETRPLI